MRDNIHPQYGPVTIRCVCGNEIQTRSTKNNIQVDICSACHPLFTGKQKLVDTAGRIDRFKKKFGDRVATAADAKKKADAKVEKEKKIKEAKQAELAAKMKEKETPKK